MEEREFAAKLEAKKEEWESFVKKAKVKTGNHTTMVRFYNAIYNFMIMTVILIAGELWLLTILLFLSLFVYLSPIRSLIGQIEIQEKVVQHN